MYCKYVPINGGVLSYLKPLHFTIWWQGTVQRTLASHDSFFIDKWMKNWTFMQTMDHIRKHLGTLCRNKRNTPSCIFPYFQCLDREIMQKMHPWSSDYIFSAPVCTHDIISMKTMLPSGRAHSQLYPVQVWSQSDWWFLRYSHFCILTPCSCSCSCSNTLPECQPLPLCYFTWYATHGLPSASSCTTPYIQLGCQWPNVRVSPIQVPAWDLDQICKIKAEEKHDYLLCILGKEGYAAMDRWIPADEAHKNNPVKFSDYTERMLDNEISPQVCVYKLEDIT